MLTHQRPRLIPNGDIRALSNLTSQWAQVIITFNLDYETEVERVVQALEEAIRIARSDESVGPELVEDPSALGWTGFTDWAVQAQIIAKTRPGKQWLVARALRRYALECLQRAGLRVAVPPVMGSKL